MTSKALMERVDIGLICDKAVDLGLCELLPGGRRASTEKILADVVSDNQDTIAALRVAIEALYGKEEVEKMERGEEKEEKEEEEPKEKEKFEEATFEMVKPEEVEKQGKKVRGGPPFMRRHPTEWDTKEWADKMRKG